jgi:hypothetical protein
MNPFVRKVKTQAEKDELLRLAREEFDKAGAFSFLVAPTWEEYVAGIEASIEVEQPAFEAPASLSAVERADFERRLTQSTVMDLVFGDRIADNSTGCRAIDDAWAAHEKAELEKFLKPGRDQEASLNKIIEQAVARVLAKSGGSSLPSSGIKVRPIPERQALMPLLSNAVDENSDTDAAKFLRAFVSGDNEGMRAVVRSLVRAEAA